MGCKSCRDKISGTCKVCALVDKDERVKTVTFCNMCGVYICDECNTDLPKRFAAFLKHKLKL